MLSPRLTSRRSRQRPTIDKYHTRYGQCVIEVAVRPAGPGRELRPIFNRTIEATIHFQLQSPAPMASAQVHLPKECWRWSGTDDRHFRVEEHTGERIVCEIHDPLHRSCCQVIEIRLMTQHDHWRQVSIALNSHGSELSRCRCWALFI